MKINLNEKITIPKNEIFYKTNTGSGILFYREKGKKITRKEAIESLASNLLSFFQVNNLHWGFLSMEEQRENITHINTYIQNVKDMNKILDRILNGAEIINYTKKYIPADQLA